MAISREERNKLVEENLGLASKAVELYANKELLKKTSSIDWEDLLQTARIALLNAAEGYKPNRGIKFSTYAMTAMRNALISMQMQHMTPAELYSFEETINEKYEEAIEPEAENEMEVILSLRQSIHQLEQKYPNRASLKYGGPLIEKIYSGLTLKEAGEQLNLTYDEANTMLSATRAHLKKEKKAFSWLRN